jgi:putative ABC transport system permease protein
MKVLFESIKMALSALTANKLRAVLTTIGVVIGISTVLLMGWFISGLNHVVDDTLSIFGDDILYVDKWDWTGATDWIDLRNRRNIDFRLFEQVHDRMRLPEYVLPTASRSARRVDFGDLQLNGTTIQGVSAPYINAIGGNVGDGRFFSDVEAETGTAVAVVGASVVENLFPQGDPIGRILKIDGMPFVIVGAMPKRGGLFADFVDNQILIPINRFFSMYGAHSRVVINVKAGGADKLEDVRYETIGVMRQVRSLGPGDKDDFSVNSQDALNKSLDALRLVVYGVGFTMTGLSFLVGTIGIMNIMFVSVTERTKEIGIRKALGATRRSILLQFLVEAVVLCLLGAVVGFVITSILAVVVKSATDFEFLSATIPLSQIVVAGIVSVVVGVLAGFIPALRAARMDPVEALRAE